MAKEKKIPFDKTMFLRRVPFMIPEKFNSITYIYEPYTTTSAIGKPSTPGVINKLNPDGGADFVCTVRSINLRGFRFCGFLMNRWVVGKVLFENCRIVEVDKDFKKRNAAAIQSAIAFKGMLATFKM